MSRGGGFTDDDYERIERAAKLAFALAIALGVAIAAAFVGSGWFLRTWWGG